MRLTDWDAIRASLEPNVETASLHAGRHTLEERMRLLRVSGVSVGIVDGGRVAWEGGIGTEAAESDKPATDRTRFYTCSVSKAVTAVGAVRLVAKGVLDLDADVNSYLRGWSVRDAAGDRAKVTLRQLLSHTAGTNVHGGAGYDPSGEVPSLGQILDGEPPSITPAVRVVAPPGGQYRYSSGGCLIMQKAMTDATGLEFPELMRQEVFDPLGMANSEFTVHPPEADHARAHVSTLRRSAPETELAWPELAASGLWSTGGDLARLIVGIQSSLVEDGFLPVSLAAAMTSRQTERHDIGLGLYLLGSGASRRFSYTGAHLGWRAEMVGFLGDGKGAAVLVNNGYTGSELKSELLASIAETLAWPPR